MFGMSVLVQRLKHFLADGTVDSISLLHHRVHAMIFMPRGRKPSTSHRTRSWTSLATENSLYSVRTFTVSDNTKLTCFSFLPGALKTPTNDAKTRLSSGPKLPSRSKKVPDSTQILRQTSLLVFRKTQRSKKRAFALCKQSLLHLLDHLCHVGTRCTRVFTPRP